MNAANVGRILVSIVVVTGFMAVTILFLVTKYSGNAPGEVLTILIGVLGTNFTSVVGYWIGSSSGSSAKDDKLAALVPEAPKAATP